MKQHKKKSRKCYLYKIKDNSRHSTKKSRKFQNILNFFCVVYHLEMAGGHCHISNTTSVINIVGFMHLSEGYSLHRRDALVKSRCSWLLLHV